MKSYFINAILFVVLAFGFSSLTSCTGSEQGTPDDGAVQTGNNPASNAAPEKKSSEYPPMPSPIMQAELRALDESTFKLEDKKGKVLLVNLWATWCGPCRHEMPHLVEMQDKYRENGFEVVGLDVDEEPVEQINKFAADMKLNYQLAWADGDLYNEFTKISKFNAIPQSFLIDRDGHLRGVFLGGGKKVIATMRETVDKVMSE